jgi:hypothetical protein
MVIMGKNVPMKSLIFAIALAFSAALKGQVPARTDVVDLHEIAAALRFSESELTINDLSNEERKVSGDAVLYSYQIKSRTPYAFYPIFIAVAREGVFLTAETKKTLQAYDSIREGPVAKGGRGPFGTLSFGANISGGLLIGEIATPPSHAPFSRPEYRTAVYSIANDKNRHLDIRIAMLSAFPDGKDLIKIQGGDDYYRWVSPRNGYSSDGAIQQSEFDHRGFFQVANDLVWKSSLVATLTAVPNSNSHSQDTETPHLNPLVPAPHLGDLPAMQTAPPKHQRVFPAWLWAMGIALTLCFAVLVLRRRFY